MDTRFNSRLQVILRFDEGQRSEFESALAESIPLVASQFGWINLRQDFDASRPLCFVEWGIGSPDDLGRLEAFDQSPEVPGWWTRMQELVKGERMELIDGNQSTCLMDTL